MQKYIITCVTSDGSKCYLERCAGAYNSDNEFTAERDFAARFEYRPEDVLAQLQARAQKARYDIEIAPRYADGTVVGTITVGEGVEREERYEYAAWYTRVLLTPGVYEVRAYHNRFVAEIPGVVLSDNFQSYFGGVAIGERYDSAQNAGKPFSYRIGWNPFSAYEVRAVTKTWKFERKKNEEKAKT
jgi:hypothetical protein